MYELIKEGLVQLNLEGRVPSYAAHSLDPVSYTHLDVYKRQAVLSPMAERIPGLKKNRSSKEIW